jgi:4-hydroxy-tetrahydrodipicolinate reductase
MIKAIVTGAAGRMGSRIITLIQASEGIVVAGAVEQPSHISIGRDAGENLPTGRIGVNIEPDLQNCMVNGDVVIDFTSHDASIRNFEIAADNGCAIVIGSTGFTTEEMGKAEILAKRTPCVLSPNMSVGVNVMFKVLKVASGILGDDYDVEIVEAHHNLKKDAPSGTAMKMADIVAVSLGRDLKKVGVFSRKGLIGERKKTEIGIQTMRAGDIVGDHTVMFCGGGERLEFIHRAHSRDNFALGAIRAAKWIVGRENGLYDMQDVLGLREK